MKFKEGGSLFKNDFVGMANYSSENVDDIMGVVDKLIEKISRGFQVPSIRRSMGDKLSVMEEWFRNCFPATFEDYLLMTENEPTITKSLILGNVIVGMTNRGIVNENMRPIHHPHFVSI